MEGHHYAHECAYTDKGMIRDNIAFNAGPKADRGMNKKNKLRYVFLSQFLNINK